MNIKDVLIRGYYDEIDSLKYYVEINKDKLNDFLKEKELELILNNSYKDELEGFLKKSFCEGKENLKVNFILL